MVRVIIRKAQSAREISVSSSCGRDLRCSVVNFGLYVGDDGYAVYHRL